MLRLIFVIGILSIGSVVALQSPLYLLALYLWWAYFRPDYWIHSNVLLTLPISYIIGLVLVIRSAFSSTTFRLDVRSVLLLAILVLATLSTINSRFLVYCLPYLWDFCKTLIVTYLIAMLASDTHRLRLVVLAMGLSLSFEAAKEGWLQLLLNPGGVNVNEVAFLGDNNGVAVGMLMLVSLLIGLARTARHKYERWLHLLLAFGVLYRALATYSRGGFLSAMALGFMFLIRSPRKLRAFAGAVLAAFLTLSVMPDAFWDRMNTINVEEGQERDDSAAGRLHYWQVAVEMAKDRPLLGIGVNAFVPSYDSYDFGDMGFGRRRSVHSSWFGVLAELGVPGFLLFIASVVLALLACRRALHLARLGHISRDLGHFAASFDSALIVFVVGGSFVIFHYTELLWHVIGMTMALHYLTSRELAEHALRSRASTQEVGDTEDKMTLPVTAGVRLRT